MGIGMPELVVVLVLALIIFGAGKLPEIGTSLGKSIRNFKQAAEAPPPKPELPSPATDPDVPQQPNPNLGGGVASSEKAPNGDEPA